MNDDDSRVPDGLHDRLHRIAGRAAVPLWDPVGVVVAGRARRRRRRLVAAAPLAAGLLAVPLAWVAIAGGGDTLTQQHAGPAPGATAPADAAEEEVVMFGLRYADPAAYRPGDTAAVEACLALPGTRDFHAEYSKPPRYFVTVEGHDQILTFQECAAALPGVTVESDAGDTGSGAQAHYIVRLDAGQDDTARAENCLGLPGVDRNPGFTPEPPQYSATVIGTGRITAFADCIAAIPGAKLTRRALPPDRPVDQPALLAVHEQARAVFPEFYGGSEIAPPGLQIRLAASATPQQESAFRDWLSREHRSVLPSVAVTLSGGTEAELGAAAGRLSQVESVVDFAVDYGQGLIKVRKEYLGAARAAVGPDLVTEWIDAPPLDENGQASITEQ